MPARQGLTPSQQQRRDRILQVVGSLSAEGGFDAVQMRDVSALADVALGTLYRYFPSKEYLLASAMLAEVQALAARLAVRPPRGASAGERVVEVLARANSAFVRNPETAAAHVRAVVSGNQEVAPVLEEVTDAMRGIIQRAIASPDAAATAEIADTLNDVWLAALVGWISGMTAPEAIQQKLGRAVGQLLGPVSP